jgi:hypothetical protein
MLPAHSAGHPGSKQPHVKRVGLCNCHGQLNKESTKVLMFPFAIPCKARGIQSKECNLLFLNCADSSPPTRRGFLGTCRSISLQLLSLTNGQDRFHQTGFLL